MYVNAEGGRVLAVHERGVVVKQGYPQSRLSLSEVSERYV
jgi:hypothetical protein